MKTRLSNDLRQFLVQTMINPRKETLLEGLSLKINLSSRPRCQWIETDPEVGDDVSTERTDVVELDCAGYKGEGGLSRRSMIRFSSLSYTIDSDGPNCTAERLSTLII